MKEYYRAAELDKSILQISTELGTNNLQISVGNNRLHWEEITLNAQQTKSLIRFLKDNKVGDWQK